MLNYDEVVLAVYKYKRWPEELMGDQFHYANDKLLSKTERVILGLKCQLSCDGMSDRESNTEIRRLLNTKAKTLSAHLSKIRTTLLLRGDYDVENWMKGLNSGFFKLEVWVDRFEKIRWKLVRAKRSSGKGTGNQVL